MSLAVTVVTPEGIIQAADSRVSIPFNITDGVVTYSHLDNATKLLTFDAPHSNISVTTYGAGTIGARTAHSFLKELQEYLPPQQITVKKFANQLQKFYKEKWDSEEDTNQDIPMIFQVAGINRSQQFGEVYIVSVPGDDPPLKVVADGEFSLYYGGDKSVVERLIQGRDLRIDNLILQDASLNDTHDKLRIIFNDVATRHLLPLGAYALQDAINLARFLIETTIKMQELSLNESSVGGAIDICCITKSDGCITISKKKVY